VDKNQPSSTMAQDDGKTGAVDTSTDQGVADSLPRIESVTPVASTKWLALQTLHWKDQDGKDRAWDMATRTTKQDANRADAVVIIPLLRDHHADASSSTPPETLLVRQYRPPVRQYTLEFPAGLIDENETVEQAALRELREETGYIGEACRIPPRASRAVCMSPGLCNETVHVVLVDVDLSNPYNHGIPQPQCDEGEHCTVVRVPLQQSLQILLDNETTTPMPIMGLYLFAVGYELGRQHAQGSDRLVTSQSDEPDATTK
jgi:ADP-ribose pyrophosphatase